MAAYFFGDSRLSDLFLAWPPSCATDFVARLRPAIVGMGAIFSQILNLSRAASSVLETTNYGVSEVGWLHWIIGKLPAGFHFCMAGLFLIAIYTSRLAFGIAQLPLSLPGSASHETEDLGDWRRLHS